MSTDEFEAEIGRLKAVVGAKSDSDLARSLDLSRYAIAKWRAKGSIPPAYSFLIDGQGVDHVDSAVLFIIRRHLYRQPQHHYFLRAALQVLHTANLNPSERPIDGEVILTRLMGMASDVCHSALGKPYCETEAGYSALLSAVLSPANQERLFRTLATAGDKRTPQSDSAMPS